MNTAIDGIIWKADADTLKFSCVEGGVDEILGYSADEWLSRPGFWQSKLHPEDAGWVIESCMEASRKRLPHRLTYRMIAADGRAVWLQDNVKVIGDGDRATLSGIMIDVTELVEQRRELAEVNVQNTRFRALYDLVPVAIWEEDWTGVLEILRALRAQGVEDIDRHALADPTFVASTLDRLRVLSVNRAAVEMFRARDANDLIDRACEVFLADRPHSVFLSALASILRGERELEGVNTLRRLDGETVHVMFRISLPDILDPAPRVVICEMDISAAHTVNERFELVTRATSDVIWDFDIVNDTLWASEGLKRAFGLDPVSMFHSLDRWTDRIHPEDLPPVMQNFDDILHRGRDDWEREYRFRRGDDRYAVVRDEGFILRDAKGQAVRMVGSLVDISEQRRLEEHLVQSQKLEAIGQLTGGIAHDFNNLLTVILGNAEMLQDAVATPGAAERMAGQIIGAAERAAELTRRLLAFARQQPLAPDRFDPNAVLKGMLVLLERAITPAITLELVLEQSIGHVHVDLAMFESAVLNLCVNARDAMPNGGMLRIQTETVPQAEIEDQLAGDRLRLTVSDTGEGMDGDTLLRAFEPFFTTKPTGEGSGLGLSMVYGFVHQSGGHIRIDSRRDAGCTVEILLPLCERGTSSDGEKLQSPREETMAAPARILIVEDECQVREYTRMTVGSLGYAVEAVACPATALDLLRSDAEYDLLLSDVVMPGGMSGQQLAEIALRERPDLPVLLVSGHFEEIASPLGQPDPRIAFLRKPFRRRDLAHRLAALLAG